MRLGKKGGTNNNARTDPDQYEQTAGRYYDDETWASSETPAAFHPATDAAMRHHNAMLSGYENRPGGYNSGRSRSRSRGRTAGRDNGGGGGQMSDRSRSRGRSPGATESPRGGPRRVMGLARNASRSLSPLRSLSPRRGGGASPRGASSPRRDQQAENGYDDDGGNYDPNYDGRGSSRRSGAMAASAAAAAAAAYGGMQAVQPRGNYCDESTRSEDPPSVEYDTTFTEDDVHDWRAARNVEYGHGGAGPFARESSMGTSVLNDRDFHNDPDGINATFSDNTEDYDQRPLGSGFAVAPEPSYDDGPPHGHSSRGNIIYPNGDEQGPSDGQQQGDSYEEYTTDAEYTEVTRPEIDNADYDNIDPRDANDPTAGDGDGYILGSQDEDDIDYAYQNEGKQDLGMSYEAYEVDRDGNVTAYDEYDDAINNPRDLPPGVTVRDQQEDAMMRLLAHQLNRDWDVKAGEAISPSLERRLRDFRFAQGKRRDRYGDERPWGILGLYDHLQGVRIDVEWAEDAAWRRENDEPYLSWADFEDSRNSGFNRPWFTYFILVVCTGVLIASIGVNGWTIEPLSVNPMIGPSAETLVIMGAKQTSLIVNDGQWYRLFTPMFLHAGLIHYLLNMLALWFIGSAVEQSHGFVSAAIIFVISAVGGNILSAIFLPDYISVGASGGIFGLIGACIADIAINWNLLFSKQVNQTDEGTRLRHVKVLIWLLFDILINCLIGLTPFVDNFTHLGGMMYGFLCGLSTIERLPLDFFGTPHDSCSRVRNYAVRFFGLILSVILIMISTAVLVESDGGTSPCSNCRYVSCVPFPFWASEEDKWWYCDDCDQVTADANKDEATGYFEELVMTCPDGSVESIDLSGQDIKDKEWLRGQLPAYCRKNCDNVFARF